MFDQDVSFEIIYGVNYTLFPFFENKFYYKYNYNVNMFIIGVAHAMISANNYSAIIGPQCSAACRPVARLAAYMNIAVFSGVCDDADMENKDEFKVEVYIYSSS